MDWILPRLALGNLDDAQAYLANEPSSRHCFMNVCQLSYEAPGYGLVWHPIADEVCHPPPVWRALVQDLWLSLQAYETVLVHCRLGKSRSPALVAAYLTACGQSVNLEWALTYVTQQHGDTEIHPETWRGAVQWWEGR
jgi:hypothetical protein